MLDLISIYFGTSEPGAAIHHLVLGTCDSRTPLGLPDTSKLALSVYVIAPVYGEGEADRHRKTQGFIADALRDAAAQTGPAWVAAFTMEVTRASVDNRDEAAENRLRRMEGDGQIHRHPSAAEQTLLYAACADGRRWHGVHTLTGPQAGHLDGPHLIEGRATDIDRTALHGRKIRRAVGITW